MPFLMLGTHNNAKSRPGGPRTALARTEARYSAAFGKVASGSATVYCAGPPDVEMLPVPGRRRRRPSQFRCSPGVPFARGKIISMDGVTISVSTVAKDSPKTMGEESDIHHCVEGALIVVS